MLPHGEVLQRRRSGTGIQILKSFFVIMGVSGVHAKELLSDNGAGNNPNWNTATIGVNFPSVR